ncbi:sigma-54 interaction domain-containing protein [Azotosporobacter soli]|uniref:sigma-54 interaction domain-containing protein n=1 Tax=Azotosporobacter soli TaxID=3055040 RepID=UPI0031FED038
MTRLQGVQIATQQIAEAISSVLGMDVTIVDETMVRIAGTGCHQNTIGQDITGNNVYSQVLSGGNEYLISDVSTSHACENCGRRDSCAELAQLCCPVLLGQETIGVIGLVAFSAKQQRELAEQGPQLLVFMRKMAELVAAKVLESEAMQRTLLLKNQMETVLNFVAEGIVAVDHQARIINLNYAAEKLLKVKATEVIGFHISEVFPGTPVEEVLRDGNGFVDREVKLWQRGKQHHYFISAKPMLQGVVVQGVVASFRLAGAQVGPAPSTSPVEFEDIIGTSRALHQVLDEAKQAASGTSTILIGGESGTGKEVLAKAIHFASERRMGPFVAVNCAAIPETLLESELFGYEEGAFTGARRGGKPGKFQMANGGTLFLDEIGDMPVALQVKLLRVLQDKLVERVGSLQAIAVNVRILAASNRDLSAMVSEGRFREDLFYRLHVISLHLPALRQRKEDVPLLAQHFLQQQAQAYAKDLQGFDAAAMECLTEYEWPGNVRELENAVECAVVKASGGTVVAADLPNRLRSARETAPEKKRLAAALASFGSDVDGKRQAALSMGISLATLYRKMKKYGLE